mmetsp:Transcript_24942/g.49606  ORF Transcript_24942/g.49606 Transcript_24942/m.49606 type:complete len:148 (-) Transcript_24942:32-475(-)
MIPTVIADILVPEFVSTTIVLGTLFDFFAFNSRGKATFNTSALIGAGSRNDPNAPKTGKKTSKVIFGMGTGFALPLYAFLRVLEVDGAAEKYPDGCGTWASLSGRCASRRTRRGEPADGGKARVMIGGRVNIPLQLWMNYYPLSGTI